VSGCASARHGDSRMSGTIPRSSYNNQGHYSMTSSVFLPRWSVRFALAISLAVILVGCATVPGQYVRMAEPGATLTALTAHPENYREKVVLLGGAIVEEEENAQYLWLRVRNRPLDKEYVPRLPMDNDSAEAGHYWVMMPRQQIPREYRHWARMTVVGRVTGTQRLANEPVLSLLYVRGWGTSAAHDAVWEDSSDPNYVPSVPAGVGGEFSGGGP